MSNPAAPFVSSTEARCPKCGHTESVLRNVAIELGKWKRKCQCGFEFMFQTGMIVSPAMIQTPVKPQPQSPRQLITLPHVPAKSKAELPDLETTSELDPGEALATC